MALLIDKQNEERIIGMCLCGDNEALYGILDKLNPSDFFSTICRKMYIAIVELAVKGKPVDAISLGFRLKEKGEFEECGGNTNLVNIANVNSTANWGASVGKQIEYSQRQKLLQLQNTVESMAENLSVPPNQTIEFASNKLLEIGLRRTQEKYLHIAPLSRETIKRIKDRRNGNESTMRTPSFIDELNDHLNGGYPAGLTMIGGIQKSFKTTLALLEAMHIANTGKHVGFVSLEMDRFDLVENYLSGKSFGTNCRVDRRRLESAVGLTDSEVSMLESIANDSDETNIWIDDRPGQDLYEIGFGLKARKAMGKLDFAVIDCLYKIGWRSIVKQCPNGINEAWPSIVNYFKDLSRDLNVPIILIHHFKKGAEDRRDKRPRSGDYERINMRPVDLQVSLFRHCIAYEEPDFWPDVLELHLKDVRKGGEGGKVILMKLIGEYGLIKPMDGVDKNKYLKATKAFYGSKSMDEF